jgi:hypothetical protein
MGIEILTGKDAHRFDVFCLFLTEGAYINLFAVHDAVNEGDSLRSLTHGDFNKLGVKGVNDGGVKLLPHEHDKVGAVEIGAQVGRGTVGDIG